MRVQRQFSIWFVIGLQLTIFGLLILGVSIFNLWVPPPVSTVLGEYHPGIYWGALILALGLFYSGRFWPKNGSKLP